MASTTFPLANHGSMDGCHKLIIIRPHVYHIVISSPHPWIMLTFSTLTQIIKKGHTEKKGERVKVTAHQVRGQPGFQEDLSFI